MKKKKKAQRKKTKDDVCVLTAPLRGRIPPEIINASQKIEMWAKQNGPKDWMICGVADRSYCERIKDKRDQLLVFAHLCKSVIQSGEPWTTTMQQTYDTVTSEKTGNWADLLEAICYLPEAPTTKVGASAAPVGDCR